MKRSRTWLTAIPIAGLLVMASCAPRGDAGEYAVEIERHREQRSARLTAPDGWLTLTALVWLDEGDNSFGSDPGNAVVLPAEAAPSVAGNFVYDGRAVRVKVRPEATLLYRDLEILEGRVPAESAGNSDPLRLGRLSLHVIRRGDRYAVRVKDPENPARREFEGLEFFPVDPAFRVEGRFRPHAKPAEIEVDTVAGPRAAILAPGVVEFTLEGALHTLEALDYDPDDTDLNLIFRDGTSGKETYAAGRYLVAARDGDRVVLDFNQAYNPPCAFTAFATCPLPPPGNRIAVRIEAGEKARGDH